MKIDQQEETRLYFKKVAPYWNQKSAASVSDKVNVIKQRNDYVLRVIKNRKETKRALDAGCGTGDLVCSIAKKRIYAIGIDFADEMIKIADDKKNKQHLNYAKFIRASILDFKIKEKTYDVISANGFIEYISIKQLEQFLSVSSKGLKRGGSLILSSRNRLFNIFSLNSFTLNEIDEGALYALFEEAIAITNCSLLSELLVLDTAPLPRPSIKQANTGIDCSIRYQYTPVQLMKMLKKHKFETVDIFPIHIHGVVPKFISMYPVIHASIANLLQKYAGKNLSLLPHSSSFMIHVKKGV